MKKYLDFLKKTVHHRLSQKLTLLLPPKSRIRNLNKNNDKIVYYVYTKFFREGVEVLKLLKILADVKKVSLINDVHKVIFAMIKSKF